MQQEAIDALGMDSLCEMPCDAAESLQLIPAREMWPCRRADVESCACWFKKLSTLLSRRQLHVSQRLEQALLEHDGERIGFVAYLVEERHNLVVVGNACSSRLPQLSTSTLNVCNNAF